MSVYATHQVDVDVVCDNTELVPSRVPGQWHVRGKLRKELSALGLFAKVLDAECAYPYLRIYGQKGKLREWLDASGYKGEGIPIVKREVRN